MSVEAPQPPLSSALSWETTTHQSLPARDARYFLHENGVFQPQLNSEAACPRGRNLPLGTAGPTIAYTAESSLKCCSKHGLKPTSTFSVPSVPPVSVPAWAFSLGIQFPTHAASSRLQKSLTGGHFTLVRAVFSHTDQEVVKDVCFTVCPIQDIYMHVKIPGY